MYCILIIVRHGNNQRYQEYNVPIILLSKDIFIILEESVLLLSKTIVTIIKIQFDESCLPISNTEFNTDSHV